MKCDIFLWIFHGSAASMWVHTEAHTCWSKAAHVGDLRWHRQWPHLPVFLSVGSTLLPTDSGLGHMTDFEQCGVSKHDVSRGLFSWSYHVKGSCYPPGGTRERCSVHSQGFQPSWSNSQTCECHCPVQAGLQLTAATWVTKARQQNCPAQPSPDCKIMAIKSGGCFKP